MAALMSVVDDSIEMKAAADSESDPPVWFTKFFTGFEARLKQRLDVIVVKRLEVLLSTVKEHGVKITACEIVIEDLQSQVKKVEGGEFDLHSQTKLTTSKIVPEG